MIDASDFLKIENQNEKTLIEMALEDGDDEKQEKPTDEKNRNKENKMPVSSQENIDSLMEYKYKVERLCGILGQFQEQHHEVVNNYQKVIKENKESREKLNLTLFELESDKYLLQQNVQELTEENLKKSTEIESLKQRIEELEKERAEHMENEQQREREETERLKALKLEREKEEKEKAQRNITASSLDISATLATLPSDAKFSRTRPKSLLTETNIALSLPEAEKIDLYEDIIMDQQDILDFYSILCGTSVYKPKQTNTTASSPNTTPSKSGRPKKKKNDDEESVKNEFEYHCRVQQINKPLEDYPFTFKLNMHLREVKYIPCKDESLFNTFKEHLPCNLKTSLTHDADEAYLFLKELITKVGESAT
uniref:Uncharacterized protein n=2 Tax=Clytia hemisphaerica TaxID=252671 RepID=A0A7M5V4Y3_9CNID